LTASQPITAQPRPKPRPRTNRIQAVRRITAILLGLYHSEHRRCEPSLADYKLLQPFAGKFYAQFNNIMTVLGKYNNEMAAVHLTNSYCVLSLLYACKIWSLSNSSAHSVRVALNNLFRKIGDCCWRENPKSLLFYCGTLPALYTVDQRRILFYKKLKHHSILIRTIARLCQHTILSAAAKYGINRLENSVSSIKKSIWQKFAASVK